MTILSTMLRLLETVNAALFRVCRSIGWVALALMVVAILMQIFYRYVLNDALPWPEEAARGLMIWMAALVAPTAYRHMGFVAIDFFPSMLPARAKAFAMLAILALNTAVIALLLREAWRHTTAPLLFNSSGLNRLLQDSGLNQLLGTDLKFQTSYISAAMVVLLVLLLSVSAELMLRMIGRLIAGEDAFPDPPEPGALGGGAVDNVEAEGLTAAVAPGGTR